MNLKEGEVNEKIVITQDSVIVTMDSSLKNRAEVIAKLREKEFNYVSIIDKKVQQEELYKVQVNGLKQDIKKQERRLKWNRIQKVVLGAAIIGLIVK
jgi:phosphoribosylpyrophosphate synthetase